MNINILQANNGDSVLLKFLGNDGLEKNILIDGGMKSCYMTRKKKIKVIDGALKITLNDLRNQGKKLDLLILTHVDQDHIGGLIAWIENDHSANEMINEVWFNSGRLIKKFLNSVEDQIKDIEIRLKSDSKTSIPQGVAFENFLLTNNLWTQESVILFKETKNFFGAEFNFLSPGLEQIESLLTKWDEEEPDSLKTSKNTDYNQSITALLANDLTIDDETYFKTHQDKAAHNGSSLAFFIHLNKKNYLFLADAFPSVVCSALEFFGFSEQNPIDVELVKLSHHGSKKNNSRKLFKTINSERFVVSTDGKYHGHPDKRLLARLIGIHPSCTIYFNYPHLIPKIFQSQDRTDFDNFTVTGINAPFDL